MSKIHEAGHAKNVANFEDLVNFCRSYGAAFNPSKTSIQLASLDALLADSHLAINNVTARLVAHKNAANARKDLYAGLKPLCTRLVNALHATRATDNTLANAQSINRKIQGKRAGKKKDAANDASTDASETQRTNSVSRQSYDMQVENFSQLIEILAAEPSYHPNEYSLSIASLNGRQASMRAANSLVSSLNADICNTRIARNQILYTNKTSLHKTVAETKKYVKSIFGAKSPNYKKVAALRFTARY